MRHKRSHGGGDAVGVQLGLIITPMLDMAFQILAFFIMTYHPSALEAHVPGSLVPPEEFAKKNKNADPAAPAEDKLSIPEEDLDPELQTAITIRANSVPADVKNDLGVILRKKGSLNQIFLQTSLETDKQLIAEIKDDAGVEAAIKSLDAKLREFVPKRDEADKKKKETVKTNIKLAADGEMKQQYIMMLYDTCKKAGYSNIHFVPPPVLNSKLK
jgi:biopolymer transport protein ExbD